MANEDDDRYPKEGVVVMGEVQSVDNEGATVSLLEFNNVEGRILNLTVVGRIEPFRVSGDPIIDDDGTVSVPLTRIGISHEDRQACELKYINRKHVQTILLKVAMTSGDLQARDKNLIDMIPYAADDILEHLPLPLRAPLKDALNDAIKTTVYESFRKKVPIVVFPSFLIQKLGFCWAVSLIRHFEAMLKLENKLAKDEHLSVQDLINQTPRTSLSAEGDIDKLEVATKIIRRSGVVLERECPTTFAMPNGRSSPGTKYRAESATIFETNAIYNVSYIKFVLKSTPVAATVVWFNSYKERNPYGLDIYTPTKKEWRQHRKNPYRCKLPTHTMFLTGWGVDEHGVAYWEFQDTEGDVNNGDRGFLRFVQYEGLILEFSDIVV